MLKKSIAAALLVVMVAWAEMAMAPMFAMHVWHTHAAGEIAEHNAAHQHAMPAGHPCCPGFGKTGNAVPLEFAASTQPCQDRHRCCFLQGPQNVPAPVSAGRGLSPDPAPAEIAEINPPLDATSHVSPTFAIALTLPPDLLGMVLRV
jgi:hypothetical protein